MPVGDEPTLQQPAVRWDIETADGDRAGGAGAGTGHPVSGPLAVAGDEATLAPLGPIPEDLLPGPAGDPQWDWPGRSATRGLRLRIPTAVLLALLLLVGGLWGGAELQRSHGTGSSGTAGLASSFPGFAGRGAAGRGSTASPGSGSGTGAGGLGFGGAAPTAAGTVTDVKGDTIWITTSSGDLERITVSKTTTVTREASSTAAGLKDGDTVIVRGTQESNGSVSASSITATAAGVTSGLGGFSPSGDGGT